MKILAIRIKNLASLEGITEIDFTQEPLCSAGIFAITGPTGAGKSTIFDALCLALYGKTPRYLQAKENGIDLQDVSGNTIRQDDVKGILRDGTADGFAEVDFKAVDDQRYRANWSVRRARNRIDGSLQPETITLTNISTGAPVPGKKTELQPIIERLIGLNFEQFTRSVLLAQGDFTAFLKAGKDDKSSLLEKLTGTHIYSEISRMVFEKTRFEEQQLRDLNLKKEGVITLPDAEIARLHEEELACKNSMLVLGQQLEEVNRELAWHERLVELQQAVTTATSKQEAAIADKHNSRESEEKLQLVERVQPTRSWVDALQTSKTQLEEKKLARERLVIELAALQQEQQQLEKQKTAAAEKLLAEKEAMQQALPLLDTAKQLDVQLFEKKQQVEDVRCDLQKSRDEKQQHLAFVKSKEDEATVLADKLDSLHAWIADNSARQPVAENSALIISKLEDAKQWVLALQNNSNAKADAEAGLQQIIIQQKNLEQELQEKTASLELVQQEYNRQQQHLNLVSIEKLETEKLEADQLVEQFITAQSHWALLFDAEGNYAALHNNWSANNEDLGTKQAMLGQLAEKLSIAKTQKETSAAILEKAKLTLADNIENLRSQLTDGEPCPVCGSTAHPYALHDPRLDLLLSQLEAEYDSHDKSYTGFLKEQSGLERSIADLLQTMQQQQKELKQKAPVLEDLRQTWRGFALYQQCNEIHDEAKSMWLQQQVQANKIRQASLLAQVQEYHNNRKQLELQKQAILSLEKEQNSIENNIKDAARNIASLQDSIDRNTIEAKKLNTALATAVQFLAPFFPKGDWFNNWKNNPAAFIKRIEVFAAEWQQKNEQLEANAQSLDVLKASVATLNLQSGKYLSEVNQKEIQLKNIEKLYDDLHRQRASIFNGRPAAIIESDLRNAIDVAEVQLKQLEEEFKALQNACTKSITQQEETDNQVARLVNEITSYQQRISNWLLQHNQQHGYTLSEVLLLELLLYKPEWIEQQRAALRLLDDAVTETTSVLNERKIALQQHDAKRMSDQLPEALSIVLADIKQQLDYKARTVNEIAFMLQQDSENKSKIGGLLKQIDAQSLIAENWGKLNEIIGSADGKKFRQVAQEYTLDVLLGYANHHLQTLTQRYKMQRIPNSLGLQVLDQDMGDEIRTVFSLSGGESFLVSLALALGLASLSSSRMKVESLFIDEGFGSLDPATLNIAMDALERLHNQGRKVGVISHVQEMTERIPVQIKVSKQQSGRSIVEVVG